MSKPRLKYVACHRGPAAIELLVTPGLLGAAIKKGPLKGCCVAQKPNAAGKRNTFRIKAGLGMRRFALEFRPVIRIEL
jgi:hypothetical protein